MANEIAVLEKQLAPLTPHFEEALAGVMPVSRLIRTALISVEKNPSLMNYDRQSFFNTIMSAGVLGLEMDGVTGQAFPIPFKGKVQLVIGYKGYSTLGARAGMTITGGVVREGDDVWDFQEGTGGFVRHKKKLDNKGRIIAAWAQAASFDRPPIISVLGIGEVLAIKERSPGAKKGESPWNDPIIGFEAMASKSAKRRLARSMPLNLAQPTFHQAARMEEAFEEQGRSAYVLPGRGVVVDGESPIADREPSSTPDAADMMAPRLGAAHGVPEEILEEARKGLREAAEGGEYPLSQAWRQLAFVVQKALEPEKEGFKKIAREIDQQQEGHSE